jgi:hypothetical protein
VSPDAKRIIEAFKAKGLHCPTMIFYSDFGKAIGIKRGQIETKARLAIDELVAAEFVAEHQKGLELRPDGERYLCGAVRDEVDDGPDPELIDIASELLADLEATNFTNEDVERFLATRSLPDIALLLRALSRVLEDARKRAEAEAEMDEQVRVALLELMARLHTDHALDLFDWAVAQQRWGSDPSLALSAALAEQMKPRDGARSSTPAGTDLVWGRSAVRHGAVRIRVVTRLIRGRVVTNVEFGSDSPVQV